MATAAAILEQVSRLTARDRSLAAAWRGEPVEAPPDKVLALSDTVRVLDGAAVHYALIGGVAVAIHAGVPRATLDVDIAVQSTTDVEALVDAFVRAGFRSVGRFAHSVNLRHSGGEPVQLAFDAFFDGPISRAETFDVGGRAVRLVRKDDLVALKERSASDPSRRPSKALRDRADLALLQGDIPDPDEGW